MWIARRSLEKQTAPGELDQIVAGGQPAGTTLADNLDWWIPRRDESVFK